MIHHFQNTYDNMWHFTVESILPIIDNLDNIKEGDTVLVPNYPTYPVSLVKRILPNNEVSVANPITSSKHELSYLEEVKSFSKVRLLCNKLMSYLVKKEVKTPSVYLSFRLHNRVWLPKNNIQRLIDSLKEKYTVILSLNPKAENVSCRLNFTDVVPVYDLSYEEQLSYAMAADYSIHVNGAGMIFPQIVGIPAVVINPCLCSERYPIGPSFHNYENLISLSDKKEVSCWNSNIENITVEQALEAFQRIEKNKC